MMNQPDIDYLRLQLSELIDREQVRDLLHRYCRAVDRGDAALMKSCYHEDGTDDHGFFVGRGWDFADYVLPLLAQLERSIHSLSNPIISVRGNKAYAETQWSVIHRLKRWGKLTDMWHQGRYLDELERRDGQWRILKRVTVLDAERWIHTADMQRLVPADHPNRVLIGQRGPGDPVYQLHQLRRFDRPAFALPRLWEPLRQVLALPILLIHLLGALVQRRG